MFQEDLGKAILVWVLSCRILRFQRLLINPVRVRTFGQNQQHLGWFIIAFATKDSQIGKWSQNDFDSWIHTHDYTCMCKSIYIYIRIYGQPIYRLLHFWLLSDASYDWITVTSQPQAWALTWRRSIGIYPSIRRIPETSFSSVSGAKKKQEIRTVILHQIFWSFWFPFPVPVSGSRPFRPRLSRSWT